MPSFSQRLSSLEKPSRRPAEDLRYVQGKCALGPLLVAFSEKGIVSVEMGKPMDVLMENLQQRFPEAALVAGDREDRATMKEVIAYVNDPSQKLDAPVDLRGTEFQIKVWQAVREVPAGETATYRDIAEQIGAPRAMRAVGSACANNNHAMVVPCHRILRSDGTYAGGIDWCGVGQEALIRREKEK